MAVGQPYGTRKSLPASYVPESRHLVRVIEDFTSGPMYCIVMNFCEGGTLDGLIRKKAKQIKANEDKEEGKEKKAANGFGLLELLRIFHGLARGLLVIRHPLATHHSLLVASHSSSVFVTL